MVVDRVLVVECFGDRAVLVSAVRLSVRPVFRGFRLARDSARVVVAGSARPEPAERLHELAFVFDLERQVLLLPELAEAHERLQFAAEEEQREGDDPVFEAFARLRLLVLVVVVRDLLEVFGVVLDERVQLLVQVEVEVLDLAEEQGRLLELLVGRVVDQEVLVDKVVALHGEAHPRARAVGFVELREHFLLDVVLHGFEQAVDLPRDLDVVEVLVAALLLVAEVYVLLQLQFDFVVEAELHALELDQPALLGQYLPDRLLVLGDLLHALGFAVGVPLLLELLFHLLDELEVDFDLLPELGPVEAALGRDDSVGSVRGLGAAGAAR